MPKQRIIAAINDVLNEQFGFEIYIAMKDGEQLVKRFVLDEGSYRITPKLPILVAAAVDKPSRLPRTRKGRSRRSIYSRR